MFSQKERAFLRALAEGPGEASSERLRQQFPNPVYRRRLLWGIRRKALSAAGDWELYARAAAHERRVMTAQGATPADPIPTYTEPLAALVQALLRIAKRPRAETDPGPAGGSP